MKVWKKIRGYIKYKMRVRVVIVIEEERGNGRDKCYSVCILGRILWFLGY